MAYDKLSLASFKESLKSKKYETATGARRAVGKAQTLSDAEKDQARKAIDAHFGSAPIKAAPTKTAPKKTGLKTAKAAPKAAGKKPMPPKVSSAKKTAPIKSAPHKSSPTPAAQARSSVQTAVESTLASFKDTAFEDLRDATAQVRLAESVSSSVSAGINALVAAKTAFPDAELAPFVEELGRTLTNGVSVYDHLVVETKAIQAGTIRPRVKAAAPSEPVAKQTPNEGPPKHITTPVLETSSSNGLPARTAAENLFRESAPPVVEGLARRSHGGPPEDPDTVEVLGGQLLAEHQHVAVALHREAPATCPVGGLQDDLEVLSAFLDQEERVGAGLLGHLGRGLLGRHLVRDRERDRVLDDPPALEVQVLRGPRDKNAGVVALLFPRRPDHRDGVLGVADQVTPDEVFGLEMFFRHGPS